MQANFFVFILESHMSLACMKFTYFPRSQVDLNLTEKTATLSTEKGRLTSLKVLWEVVTDYKFADP